MRILIVWSWTREHCIAWKLAQSSHKPEIYCFWSHINPWIAALTKDISIWNIQSPEEVQKYAKDKGIDLAIIWPEAPLAAGVADALRKVNIPVVGPTKELAQLETSKAFTRNLIEKYNIWANPVCKHFSSMEWVEEFIHTSCHAWFVIKHNGLKWGKWVMVMDDHFIDLDEGLVICEDIIWQGESFLIEEKIYGQEFSLFSFNDGTCVQHSLAIQDHKRAYEWDNWPNTWWMWTFSDVDHSLPFLTPTDIQQAKKINEKVAVALQKEYNQPYQWIMYGGFMVTKKWVQLIEYNARFGDPEIFNLLTLLETDFVDLCLAITQQTLKDLPLRFSSQASVCKYLVPNGYPNKPTVWWKVCINTVPDTVHYFLGSLEQEDSHLVTLWSRAIAIIAIWNSIYEAQDIVEDAMSSFSGPLEHRRDIWTHDSIQFKIDLMHRIRD